MDLKVAKAAGFCYGVRRALDTVLGAVEQQGRPMFTLGPLIHNPQVIERLERQGVKAVRDLAEVPDGATVVLPSHGAPGETVERAVAAGYPIIDVTCPFVRKVQKLASELVADGYQVIILGDEGHTEVRGIMSTAGKGAVAVSDLDDLEDQEIAERVGIVSQTTQTIERYERLVEEVSRRASDVCARNTICHATSERQKAALEIAGDVDVMLVVGGRNSANTRRLAEICAGTGVPTHHVEVAAEIDDLWFAGARTVGVTAGASTPDWIIEEVVKHVSQVGPDRSAGD